jgi:hypothetical protein
LRSRPIINTALGQGCVEIAYFAEVLRHGIFTDVIFVFAAVFLVVTVEGIVEEAGCGVVVSVDDVHGV